MGGCKTWIDIKQVYNDANVVQRPCSSPLLLSDPWWYWKPYINTQQNNTALKTLPLLFFAVWWIAHVQVWMFQIFTDKGGQYQLNGCWCVSFRTPNNNIKIVALSGEPTNFRFRVWTFTQILNSLVYGWCKCMGLVCIQFKRFEYPIRVVRNHLWQRKKMVNVTRRPAHLNATLHAISENIDNWKSSQEAVRRGHCPLYLGIDRADALRGHSQKY